MTYDLVVSFLALLFSCFVVGVLLGVAFSKPIRRAVVGALKRAARGLGIELARAPGNPIIAPGRHLWEAEAVLNPAALDCGGRVHLIYRAIGTDGVSRLGYASSPDGYVFDERLPYPVYVAQNPRAGFTLPRRYSPVLYPSGGSWGGCEDPRMVAIEGRVYLTFNMFDGWDFIRVAMLSLSERDFFAKRFAWRGPKILSPAGEVHKNWVLFPEKVGGRFAILHSVYGEDANHVRVEYTDDLEAFDPETLRGRSVDPNAMPRQPIAWHTKMKSAGPPPLKTEKGWLVFYHAYGEAHGRYELGALLLDPADPTRVLHRAPEPVLSPNEHYENHGRAVIYACGAVVRPGRAGDGTLFVYYGGADRVVCAAVAPLAEFLDALTHGEPAALSPHPLETP